MNASKRAFFIGVAVVTAVIHLVFCVQAFLPLREGGMASSGPFLLIFYPQYMLDFFVPPAYPVTGSGATLHVNYLAFVGKMLVALPASVAYAALLVGARMILAGLRQRKAMEMLKVTLGVFASAVCAGLGLFAFG